MADVTVTHIGGPTALIEVDGWRLLTDPTFDPPRRTVELRLGCAVSDQKLTGPAVSAALIHLGGVRFPMSGPLRYTMNAQEAVEACRLLNPRTVIPLHYEGWKHFRQSPAEARRVFASSPFSGSTRWLKPGVPTTISV